jgi:two-component system chemotaxis sensor kinase CheA
MRNSDPAPASQNDERTPKSLVRRSRAPAAATSDQGVELETSPPLDPGIAPERVEMSKPEMSAGPLDVAVAARQGPGRWGLSIGQKLGLLICGLQLAIVASLALYFQQGQLQALTEELESKADTYAQLVSAQVSSAVAFDDKETAREVFDAVSSDKDLSAAALWHQDGKLLHALGSPGKVAQNAKGGVARRQVFNLPDRVLAVAPVISREGPTGTLALEFTKDKLSASRARLQRAAGLAGGLALIIGSGLALLIAQSFARRLRAISVVAEKVAAGDLSQKAVADRARDELGSLARSFATMLDQIRVLFTTVQRQAAEEQSRLETLVRARTAELAERNVDMRRVLDNVDQGFLTIDTRGVMSGERSAIVDRWLGPPPASGSLWQYVDRVAPGMGQNLELGWEAVVDGFLPMELALEQMPSRFEKDGQHFALAYKPISSADAVLERAVVVLSDITPSVLRERAEIEQREALRLFSRVNEDRASVLEFFAEARRMVALITRETPTDRAVTKRLVHTLKGNAGMFGIERLTSLCHAIEDSMEDTQSNISSEDCHRLDVCWTEIDKQLSVLTGENDRNELTISTDDHSELLRAIVDGKAVDELRALLESWKLESTEVRLRRAARHAQALAERLGKVPIEVQIESNKVRLDPQMWKEIWAEFPHLIRNAIDHGLSPAPISGEPRKPETLHLRTRLDESQFVIEIEDSGRGVDWERVRELAVKRGLPATTRHDLEQALFADGLSTKDRVDETSGRGVGMGAVAAAVRTRGGSIRVHSDGQKGTRVQLSWPAAAAHSRRPPPRRRSSTSQTKA